MLLAVGINYINHIPNASEIEKGKNSLGSGNVFTDPSLPKKVRIDIEGAVQQPGIYEMTNDSRIQDVLITAGGMTAKANRTYVSKNINLAQRVYDGLKIYVPEETETYNQVLGDKSTDYISDVVNINTASVSQLDNLPGIGEVTANKIIGGRPYQSISQLIEKHIVSQSVYQKIKDRITVDK